MVWVRGPVVVVAHINSPSFVGGGAVVVLVVSVPLFAAFVGNPTPGSLATSPTKERNPKWGFFQTSLSVGGDCVSKSCWFLQVVLPRHLHMPILSSVRKRWLC